MKNKIVLILSILGAIAFTCMPLAMLNGCGTSHPTTIGVTSTNGNVGGSVVTEITTNISAGVNGTYDPTSGQWTAGLVITFKDAPSAADVELAQAAGASPVRTDASVWIIAQVDLNNAAQTEFVEAALKHGAKVERIVNSMR